MRVFPDPASARVPHQGDDVRRLARGSAHLFEGIATGNATFETEAPPWEKWDSSHIRDCRLNCARWPEHTGMGGA